MKLKSVARSLPGLITALVVAVLLGYFVLITPDNPLFRVFRGEISDTNTNVVTGPYPVERDFAKLKKAGVGTIVSLLDPTIPYEKSLLEQERALAQRHQIELLNFPMISVLGQKFGKNYDANAHAAAAAIATAQGKVYVHCYLGIHRIRVVKELLTRHHIATGSYTLHTGERSTQAAGLDEAERLYNQGAHAQAQQALDSLPSLTPPAQLLYAWTLYHQNKIADARKRFAAVQGLPPEAMDREVGLAYCNLRENRLADAEKAFAAVLRQQPRNEAALTGLGIALYRQGRTADAVIQLRAALKLNPDNAEAATILGRTAATQP